MRGACRARDRDAPEGASGEERDARDATGSSWLVSVRRCRWEACSLASRAHGGESGRVPSPCKSVRRSGECRTRLRWGDDRRPRPGDRSTRPVASFSRSGSAGARAPAVGLSRAPSDCDRSPFRASGAGAHEPGLRRRARGCDARRAPRTSDVCPASRGPQTTRPRGSGCAGSPEGGGAQRVGADTGLATLRARERSAEVGPDRDGHERQPAGRDRQRALR